MKKEKRKKFSNTHTPTEERETTKTAREKREKENQ